MVVSRSPLVRLRPLALCMAVLFALFASVPSASAHGKYYNHAGSIDTSHPAWMRWLPDGTNLAQISLPGTHDTMALYGGDLAQTQGLGLRAQLDAGIRALDIRCRHIDNRFAIHHGVVYQNANFDDVLGATVQFLREHPSETIVMRVKEEHTPANTSRTFAQTFEWYRDQPAYSPYIWRGTGIPSLGEVRGKIIILDNFGGGAYGIDWGSLRLQDDYEVPTIYAIDDKWEKVKSHLAATNASGASGLFVNFLSGSSAFAYPNMVAGGGLGITGVNEFAIDHLVGGGAARTGVMMMDFPGAGLIDAIIALDFRLAASPASLADDFATALNNISATLHSSGDDEARDRVEALQAFLGRVLPGQPWHVIVSGTQGSDQWGYSVQPDSLYVKSDWFDGYSHVAFNGAGQSVVGADLLNGFVDGQVGGLSGNAVDRAGQLAAKVRARFPYQRWSVLVKRAPGGFDNWAYGVPAAAYHRWVGDYAYAVWGYGPQEGVYLYQHIGYAGDIRYFNAAYADLRNNGFNDQASSIRIVGNYRANLWEHINNGGAGLSVTQTRDDLVGSGWNDRASSIEVWRSGP